MTPLLTRTAALAQILTGQEGVVLAVAAAIVVLAAAYGWRDVGRFAFRRVRAIAHICYIEAIRRRILWIVPLAIVGVVAVTQLTRPVDEQDAIRQTTRYALFATGMIVVLAAILLAATNLPKEIESRVIFTIVTKPTTRLEIVLGKILGFSLVSGLILLIMGAFTFVYLEARAWSMVSAAKKELAVMAADDEAAKPKSAAPASAPSTRSASGNTPEYDAALSLNRRIREQTLRRYVDGGLLGTRSIRWPADLQVFARDPDLNGDAADDEIRYIGGTSVSYAVAPLVISDAEQQQIIELVKQGHPPFLVVSAVPTAQASPTAEEVSDLAASKAPLEGAGGDAFGPTTAPTTGGVYRPRLQVVVRSTADGAVIAQDLFMAKGASAGMPRDPAPSPGWKSGQGRIYPIPLIAQSADGKTVDTAGLSKMLDAQRLNVEITSGTPTYDFGLSKSPVALVVPSGGGNQPLDFVNPLAVVRSSTTASVDPDPHPGATEAQLQEATGAPGIRFLARFGRTGSQLIGRPPEEGDGAVAVYRFTGVGEPDKTADGKVVLQTKLGVDRGGDLDAERYRSSVASIVVRNRQTKFVSPPVSVEPQTGRTIEVAVPAEAVAGGDFDVLVRGRTPGQHLSLYGLTASVPSMALVRAEQSFAVNLVKSLAVLWLLSVMVVSIAVFCSTFLSWPIAVILTVLLLLGRWGVEALGDSLAPGSSRGVAQELFKIRDPSKNKAVTDSLEVLSTALRNVGPVLPDINRFPAFEDVERGVSMEPAKLARAGLEVLMYGLPMALLTYVILRHKEVAP